MPHEAADLSVRLRSAVGYVAMIGIAFAFSRARRAIARRTVLWGIGLQFAFALVVLRLPSIGRPFFDGVGSVFDRLLKFTGEGARFVLGSLAVGPGEGGTMGFIFVTQVLPTIIFFASLMTVLYHLGVMQLVVGAMAKLMQVTMRTSGAESLSAAANIFVGQTEAPLLVKPFVGRMTASELMAVMVGGFSTIAGGVMAAYIGFLRPRFPDIAGHLLAASVMNAPAGLLLAKIFLPETGEPETRGKLRIHVERPDANVIGAAARGAGEGVTLVLNVTAMLLAFTGLIALLNALLGWAGGHVGIGGLTLQSLLGSVLRPIAWLLGVNWGEAGAVGGLLGEKIVLNEFVAYSHLGDGLAKGTLALTDRSVTIASYGLLGFANFASIAIQIGGIGGLAPERRGDLARLGLRAMIAGTLAAYMSAAIAGILV
ncbi:MAG TPA: nucleoside transporter C-terminal domain-containing protein [Planctomycetota bacterium]|nr:nucleoside transporter C-terminal domain-containing protein [Planctomycetota bacterium]